jgi:thymidylate synthase
MSINRDDTKEEDAYLTELYNVMSRGEVRDDRTGVGTRSLFGRHLAFDLTQGFPLLTTKKLPFRHIVHELFWFLSGSTSTEYLQQHGVKIWEKNSSVEFLRSRGLDYPAGHVGPLYGFQWRNFGGDLPEELRGDAAADPIRGDAAADPIRGDAAADPIRGDAAADPIRGDAAADPIRGDVSPRRGVDQIDRVLQILRTDPTSRRMVISAWNPCDLDKMALEPCHILFQLYVREGKYLDGSLYMRSNDLFLGAPWNIACYSLLISLYAHLTGYTPGRLVYTVGDAHVYLNHLDQVSEQIQREPRKMPRLVILDRGQRTMDDFVADDIQIEGYEPWPAIRAEMAV